MDTHEQVFRMGNNIVVPKGASLPALCVKCGNSEVTTVEKYFIGHNHWFHHLAHHGGPLAFLILYFLVGEKITLAVPLCVQHRELVSRMKIATAILLIGAPLVEVLLIIFASDEVKGMGIVGVLFALIGGFITLRVQRTLIIIGFEHDRAILKGAGKIFLSRLATTPTAPRR